MFLSREWKRIKRADKEYEAIVMENFVDSEYMQSEDAIKTTKNATSTQYPFLSSKTEEKKQSKGNYKMPRIHKKIASQDESSRWSVASENVTTEKKKRHGIKQKVLNKLVTETSVQKKTKKIKRIVPDRLGKYVSYSVRSDTKLSSNECKLKTKPSLKRPSREDHSQTNVGCTKLDSLENECLSNNEAVRLRNSESDSDRKNIFENFFDSTRADASSHENLKESEKTPEGKKKETSMPPPPPVKNKDHSNYHSSHKNIRHVCAYCQKIFKSNGKLNSHVYSHTGERPFDCSHCGKAFSSKFKLVRHLLIHSEIRRFVCQICDRTFLRNDHLKNHYKVHDPQKKMYKCPKENCDKEYSSVMSHKKHMAYHNVEDGDLKCLICNVKYETKEEVLFHLKSHSGSRLFKSQSDKKFKCEFCDRLFLTRKDVTRHLVVHTGERDFLCQFCPQRFGRKDHLVRHIKKSHGNEDLVKEDKNKEEAKKSTEEPKQTPPNPPENSEESNKTHIVITVQGKTPLQNQKRNSEQKKPFQELLVPKKKQLPLAKGKNSTTQIFLKNIPNILIIPNNSIILLKNQATLNKGSKSFQEMPIVEPDSSAPSQPEIPLPTISPLPSSDASNFSYDANLFMPPSHFMNEFPEPNFSPFQPDLPSFDEPDFEMLNQNDLLPRPDSLSSTSLQAPEKEEKTCEDIEKELFENGMLNESMLNEFKDESGVLAGGGEVGILGNILNQNENCGFELLRHLLTSENPVLSPLPGFNQIFHNSNANSN